MIRFFICFLIVIFLLGCKSKLMVYNDLVLVYKLIVIDFRFVGEECIINIWMFFGYEDGGVVFFVLYMLDGGVGEDFLYIVNILVELIKSNEIELVIFVGIENIEWGRDLIGVFIVVVYEKYGILMIDGVKNFRLFIFEEFVFEIECSYRIIDKNGIIGELLVGLFVVEIFLL